MIKNRTQNVVKNTVIHFTRKHFNRYRQFFKARAMNSVAAVILQLFLSTLIIDGEIIDSSTVVEIEQGKLAGTVLTSRNGDRFYAFHSIPYAKPPIESLRFKVKRIINFTPFIPVIKKICCCTISLFIRDILECSASSLFVGCSSNAPSCRCPISPSTDLSYF